MWYWRTIIYLPGSIVVCMLRVIWPLFSYILNLFFTFFLSMSFFSFALFLCLVRSRGNGNGIRHGPSSMWQNSDASSSTSELSTSSKSVAVTCCTRLQHRISMCDSSVFNSPLGQSFLPVCPVEKLYVSSTWRRVKWQLVLSMTSIWTGSHLIMTPAWSWDEMSALHCSFSTWRHGRRVCWVHGPHLPIWLKGRIFWWRRRGKMSELGLMSVMESVGWRKKVSR